MTNGLHISDNLTLPPEAVGWAFADLAIRGAGKTWGGNVFAEEMMKQKTPVLCLDPMGVWWGLRVGVNSKGEPDGSPGFEIVVFGGQHADLPLPIRTEMKGKRPVVSLDEDKLRLMVKSILEARISAILDTSGLTRGLQHRIIAIFTSELMRLYELNAAKYGPRHVFIEEASRWCPQRGVTGEVAVSTGAIESLVMQGGNYNLGCTLITQRSAALNKNVLSQASCLIVLRILHQLDKNAVKAWVESMADPKDPKIAKWYDGLRDLQNGEAWVWHPESNLFKKIKFRKRETLHATREYFRSNMNAVEMMDVGAFVDKFKKVFKPPKPKETQPRLIPEKATFTLGKTVQTPFGPQTQPSLTHIPIEPPVTLKNGDSMMFTPQNGDVVAQVTQATPVIQLLKVRPNIGLSLDLLNEPTTPLGRTCAVLAGTQVDRDDRWTNKRIKALVKEHAWDEEGVDASIDQLLRWEILYKQSNGYLRFYRERIQVMESTVTVGAQ